MATYHRLARWGPAVSACPRAPTLIGVVLLITATPALAQECPSCCEFDGTHVILPQETETYECIRVTTNGSVIIKGTLTLTGPGSSMVDGCIQLKHPNAKLEITGNLAITGAGEIRGFKESARIIIAVGESLTNSTNITGKLRIEGPGSLANLRNIEADTSGVLLVNVSGTLADDVSASWKATAPGAVLQFGESLDDNNTSISLAGDFTISNPTAAIRINEMTGLTSAFTTTGQLTLSAGTFHIDENVLMGNDGLDPKHLNMSGGEIEVAPGKTFTHH